MGCRGEGEAEAEAERERDERFGWGSQNRRRAGGLASNKQEPLPEKTGGNSRASSRVGRQRDKRLQIEDKAHDLEGLRPRQGIGPLARMGLDGCKRCDWPRRLCVCYRIP